MRDYNYEPAETEPYDIEAAEAYDDYMADQYDVERDRALEDWNERCIISTYRSGRNDRPSNYCGGFVVTGYNTGRVIIGCRYEPPRRSHMSNLDVWWQAVLLGQKKSLLERFKAYWEFDYDAWRVDARRHAVLLLLRRGKSAVSMLRWEPLSDVCWHGQTGSRRISTGWRWLKWI